MGMGNVAGLNDIVIGSVTFRGHDEIIAVTDTGLDSSHPALTNRILVAYTLGRPGQTNDIEGRGTHVCGSVLGDSTDVNGLTIQGTAPEARLVIQSISDRNGGLGGTLVHLDTLFAQAYNDDARVHGTS